MKFSKMHGLGNDYIFINCFEEELSPDDVPSLARKMCRRRFSVGADGLILVLPSERADFRMRIFNSDGSEAEMCGNGTRCFARYVYERGLTDSPEVRVETGAGVATAELRLEAGRVDSVRIEIGRPIFEPEEVAVDLPARGGRVVDERITVDGMDFRVSCVSVGNPHCVIFVPSVQDVELERWGPKIEHHRAFPRRTNVEFCQVIDDRALSVRVWERGAGTTLACGTGAAAAAVVSAARGLTGRDVKVRLPGGDLTVNWGFDGRVHLEGPCEHVYDGEYERGER